MSTVTIAIGGVTAAVLAAAAWVTLRGDDDPFTRARALVADERGFDSATEAGETLAKVGALLLDDARSCRERSEPTARCDARSSASAYAQVLAVQVLRCTAPGRLEGRAGLLTYLDAVAAADRASAPVPQPPRLPECGKTQR